MISMKNTATLAYTNPYLLINTYIHTYIQVYMNEYALPFDDTFRDRCTSMPWPELDPALRALI